MLDNYCQRAILFMEQLGEVLLCTTSEVPITNLYMSRKVSLSLIISEKVYELPSEGLHNAVISKIDDLGLQETPWGNKEQVMVLVTMLDQKSKEGDPVSLRLYASKSLNDKSTLGQMLNQLKIAHGPSYDLGQIINLKVKVVVGHKDKKEGGKKAIAALFMPYNVAIPSNSDEI